MSFEVLPFQLQHPMPKNTLVSVQPSRVVEVEVAVDAGVGAAVGVAFRVDVDAAPDNGVLLLVVLFDAKDSHGLVAI